jgi:L-aspartate oxidase
MRCVLGTDSPGVIPGLPVTSEHAGRRRQTVPLPAVEQHDAPDTAAEWRAFLQKAMTLGAGVRRDGDSLRQAAGALGRVGQAAEGHDVIEWCEVRNLVDVAATIVAAATARTETRGAHTREDFPATDPALRARFLHGT